MLFVLEMRLKFIVERIKNLILLNNIPKIQNDVF